MQASDPDHLVLWNTMDSAKAVTQSVVGADFLTNSQVVFVDGVYGQAAATKGGETGGGGYLSMSPANFFGDDRRQGTVEFWAQKQIQEFEPFETPLLGFFGFQPYSDTPNYGSIAAFWSDGFTGAGGFEFAIVDGARKRHPANDLGWDRVDIGEWVHVACVWNLDGIDGSADRLRVYRDGKIVASNDDDFTTLFPGEAEARLLGHHAYSRFGEPTLYMDNIKVWEGAKTDFSDRFTEGLTIDGTAAADAITGSIAGDDLSGGDGRDTLVGGDGDDVLTGNRGRDRLAGGRGDDVLTGGARTDRFVFQADSTPGGLDTITDFQVGLDRIVLRAFDFADFAALDDLIAADVDGALILLSTVGGHDIRLLHVDPATLSAADFIL